MDIFASIKRAFFITEADVIAFATKVWNEVAVAEQEVAAVAKWIVGSGLPALTRDIEAITPFISLVGSFSGHPELNASMTALNAAMAGVQAFAAAANAGTLTADQVVQGYGSLKQASAAAQSVVSTAAKIVSTTQPSTLPKA